MSKEYEIFDLNQITDDQIKLLQDKNFEILKYFKDFCIEHGLMFYFCGGCLIGTIRHHGFIPWDDDVDLFMPRRDYEKLGQLWSKFADTEQYAYCRTTLDNNYHHAGTSIKDLNTTFINRHSINEDIIHAIGIEIVPIDGYPNGKIKRFIQLLNAFTFSLFNTQRLPDNKGALIRNITKVAYFVVPSKKLRFKIWKRAERQMSKYEWKDTDNVTELIGSVKGMLLKHPKEWFDSSIFLDFETEKMPVMKGYNEYLSLIFGDYMEIPPVEERIAKHDAVYINTKESYRKFKGIHYCLDQEVVNSFNELT